MQTITLQPLYHRGSEIIGIYFCYNPALINIIKQVPGIRWSRTYNCWYILLQKQHCLMLYAALKDNATINTAALKENLVKRRQVTEVAATAAAAPKTIHTYCKNYCTLLHKRDKPAST